MIDNTICNVRNLWKLKALLSVTQKVEEKQGLEKVREEDKTPDGPKPGNGPES
jgi:hypothetical protein